jgi:hypothetical protein
VDGFEVRQFPGTFVKLINDPICLYEVGMPFQLVENFRDYVCVRLCHSHITLSGSVAQFAVSDRTSGANFKPEQYRTELPMIAKSNHLETGVKAAFLF